MEKMAAAGQLPPAIYLLHAYVMVPLGFIGLAWASAGYLRLAYEPQPGHARTSVGDRVESRAWLKLNRSYLVAGLLFLLAALWIFGFAVFLVRGLTFGQV